MRCSEDFGISVYVESGPGSMQSTTIFNGAL